MRGIEYAGGVVTMTPGPWDAHGHPRAFDPIKYYSGSPDQPYEGKAGLEVYSAVALESGITGMSAMPNESMRFYDLEKGEYYTLQYPISNRDRVLAMESAIATQSEIQTAYHLGIDPDELYGPDRDQEPNWDLLSQNFFLAGEHATALKIFGAESTGGNTVRLVDIPEISRRWHAFWPKKPAIMHLEDDGVGVVLEAIGEMRGGKEIPLHIAHVSSEQELTAKMEAVERGMNVTCEATPHHMFATQDEGAQIGGHGCMKPTLKSAKDVKFMWDNRDAIDMFATDCAPHQEAEKQSGVFGVTNHTSWLAMYIGAIDEGRLSWGELYQKMVVAPRQRFGLPMNDGSSVRIDTRHAWQTVQEIEAEINPAYGQNMFPHLEKLGKRYHLLGRVVFAQSGASLFARDLRDPRIVVRHFNKAHKHLIKR